MIAAVSPQLHKFDSSQATHTSDRTLTTGTWQTLECNGSPTARHETGFVNCQGKFYLIGGRGIKPVEEFNPVSNSWRQLSPTPIEIHHFQPVALGDTIYLVGAMTGEFPHETPIENIYTYHPGTDSWKIGAEIPKNRRRGCAGTVVRDGQIFVICGIKDGHHSGGVNWFDVYDPANDSWTVLPDAPRVRDHFPAVSVDNRVYVVGGRNSSVHTESEHAAFFGATIQEVDYFDFDKREWFLLENSLPVGTAAGGLSYIDGKVIYAGGESSQDLAHSDTQILDIKSGEWSLGAPMQRGRHGSQAVVHEGEIFVAAGSGGRGGGPELSSIECFSL